MFRILIISLSPLPALIFGAVTMIYHKVPVSIWSQNLFVYFFGLAFILVLLLLNKSPFTMGLGIFFSFCIVALTFLHPGISSVNRWVSIGPIHFNSAQIAGPILIRILPSLLKKKIWIPALTVFGYLFLLFLQPDAAQFTAFAFASLVLIYKNIKSFDSFPLLSIIVFLSIFPWIYPDHLAGVPHVEGIFQLMQKISFTWFILGIVSCIIAYVPLLFYRDKEGIALATVFYFVTIYISNIFGNFPPPLIGYGSSPVFGYLIASHWLIQREYMKTRPSVTNFT